MNEKNITANVFIRLNDLLLGYIEPTEIDLQDRETIFSKLFESNNGDAFAEACLKMIEQDWSMSLLSTDIELIEQHVRNVLCLPCAVIAGGGKKTEYYKTKVSWCRHLYCLLQMSRSQQNTLKFFLNTLVDRLCDFVNQYHTLGKQSNPTISAFKKSLKLRLQKLLHEMLYGTSQSGSRHDAVGHSFKPSLSTPARGDNTSLFYSNEAQTLHEEENKLIKKYLAEYTKFNGISPPPSLWELFFAKDAYNNWVPKSGKKQFLIRLAQLAKKHIDADTENAKLVKVAKTFQPSDDRHTYYHTQWYAAKFHPIDLETDSACRLAAYVCYLVNR